MNIYINFLISTFSVLLFCSCFFFTFCCVVVAAVAILLITILFLIQQKRANGKHYYLRHPCMNGLHNEINKFDANKIKWQLKNKIANRIAVLYIWTSRMTVCHNLQTKKTDYHKKNLHYNAFNILLLNLRALAIFVYKINVFWKKYSILQNHIYLGYFLMFKRCLLSCTHIQSVFK